MRYVYADLIILINLVVNGLVLLATSKLTGTAPRPARIILAAALGSVYALLVVVTLSRGLASAPVKFLVSVVMVLVAFGWSGARTFLGQMAALYLTSLLLAGALLLLGGVQSPVGLTVLAPVGLAKWAVTFLASAGLLYLFFKLVGRGFITGVMILPLSLTFGERTVTLRGLVDTGNDLRDPFSGRPVLVVEYEALKHVLPPDAGETVCKVDASGLPPDWASRFRVIPYRSVGVERGTLVGFRSDRLCIGGREDERLGSTVVAVYPGRFAEDGKYQALIPIGLLEVNPAQFALDRKGGHLERGYST